MYNFQGISNFINNLSNIYFTNMFVLFNNSTKIVEFKFIFNNYHIIIIGKILRLRVLLKKLYLNLNNVFCPLLWYR